MAESERAHMKEGSNVSEETTALTPEQEELLARAAELEQPIPGVPSVVPKPPCGLRAADTASRQLGFNASNMRTRLDEGQRQRAQLAQFLRKAANASGETDESSAPAISSDVSAGAEQVAAQSEDSKPSNETPAVDASGGPDFLALKQAAWDLQKLPDQGASLGPFADAWTAYRLTLQVSCARFRPFEFWTGEAARAAHASLDQQREWLAHIAELCHSLAQQALYFGDAHRVNAGNHPRYEDIVSLEAMYASNPAFRPQILATYSGWQQRSQEVLSKYRHDADAVQAIDPPKPPYALQSEDRSRSGE